VCRRIVHACRRSTPRRNSYYDNSLSPADRLNKCPQRRRSAVEEAVFRRYTATLQLREQEAARSVSREDARAALRLGDREVLPSLDRRISALPPHGRRVATPDGKTLLDAFAFPVVPSWLISHPWRSCHTASSGAQDTATNLLKLATRQDIYICTNSSTRASLTPLLPGPPAWDAALPLCAAATNHLLIETEMPKTTPKKPVLLSPLEKYARRRTRWLRLITLSPASRRTHAGPAAKLIFGTSSKSANSTIFGTPCTHNSLVFQPCGEMPM